MQELNLCQDIIAMIKERSLSKSFRRVKRIQLEIGEFIQVNKHAIAFCFEQASRGTLAEGAKLEFIDIPAQNPLAGRILCLYQLLLPFMLSVSNSLQAPGRQPAAAGYPGPINSVVSAG